MTTGKTIALTRQIFVGKVMSLLFNMLSRLVIAFLPRNEHLLISWLQSSTPVILLLLLSHFSLVRLCDPMDCSTPGFSVHHQLPELAQTHVHRVGDAIQPFNLSSPSLPAFNHAQHQGLWQCLSSSRWSYSFSISPSNEYSGLISFTIDWFDLLAVQGPLKSLLQHHNSKE